MTLEEAFACRRTGGDFAGQTFGALFVLATTASEAEQRSAARTEIWFAGPEDHPDREARSVVLAELKRNDEILAVACDVDRRAAKDSGGE